MKPFRYLTAFLALAAILLLPVSAQEPPAPKPLEEAIIEAVTYDRELVLTDYNILGDELETIYDRLCDSGQLPWYAVGNIEYSYNRFTEVAMVLPAQNLDPAVYDRSLYEQKVSEILAACVFPGMADWQIALSVHEYLVTHTVYDSTLTRSTGYDLIVDGIATCAGYARAYMDLMNRAGVPCQQIICEPMNHAWNLVQISGQWYHADLTWDDPTPDSAGLSRHTHFLRSDLDYTQAESNPHHSWESDILCTATDFADAFWREEISPVCFASAEICYYLRYADKCNSLIRRNMATGEETVLYTHPMVSIPGEENRFTLRHGGLTLRGGRLYFSTLDGAVSVDTEGKDLRREYTYDTSNSRYVLGCFAGEDTLSLCITDTKNNTETVTVPLTPLSGHTHSYEATSVAPSCTAPGYRVNSCDCGVTYRSHMTPPSGHDLQKTHSKTATFFSSGYTIGQCRLCGEAQTQQFPRIDFILWFQSNQVLGIGLIVLAVLAGDLLLFVLPGWLIRRIRGGRC